MPNTQYWSQVRSAIWKKHIRHSQTSPRDDGREGGSRDGRRREERDSRGRYDDGRRRDVPDYRKIENTRVQHLPDGAVIPASGRRARHRVIGPERRSRSCEGPGLRRTEETRGRSPPASPRTTSRDVIELQPSSTLPAWLRCAPFCLGSPVSPEAPPGLSSPARLQQRAGSVPPSPSTPLFTSAEVVAPVEDQVMASPSPVRVIGTPLFVPRPSASSRHPTLLHRGRRLPGGRP